jgi:hypothetical protein
MWLIHSIRFKLNLILRTMSEIKEALHTVYIYMQYIYIYIYIYIRKSILSKSRTKFKKWRLWPSMLDCSLLKTAMMIVNTCLKPLWSPFFVYKYTCLGALFRVAFALEVCELKRCIADYCNLVKEKCMSIVNGCLSSFPIETKYTMIQSNPKLHGALSVGFYLEHNRFNKNREIRSDRAIANDR